MYDVGMDVAVLADSANVKYVSSFVVPYWTGWIGDVSWSAVIFMCNGNDLYFLYYLL